MFNNLWLVLLYSPDRAVWCLLSTDSFWAFKDVEKHVLNVLEGRKSRYKLVKVLAASYGDFSPDLPDSVDFVQFIESGASAWKRKQRRWHLNRREETS